MSNLKLQALWHELGANCVTCSYEDKCLHFHNQMNIFHKIFVKYLQTIHCYKAGKARKIDARLNFQYTGCLKCYLGKKN